MRVIRDIINDTLKKKTSDGVVRWSRTSLTMFSAWIISILMAAQHQIKNGFDYQVFLTFVVVAGGTKISDAISQKLNK